LSFLAEYCSFQPLSEGLLAKCTPFDCDHPDLNDFFSNDCINYSFQLLGKTYCFTLSDNPHTIVCAFTISNDSIKANQLPISKKNKINRAIPNPKRLGSYPAVLIGRLGVNKEYKGKGIGGKLMNFIKSWFIDENNKTGCRYLVVDSYNETTPLNYYLANGFQFLFDSEEDEKKYTGVKTADSLRTRLMYFDLIVLKS
jgi:GNAT superfamily N-acetyltransferase